MTARTEKFRVTIRDKLVLNHQTSRWRSDTRHLSGNLHPARGQTDHSVTAQMKKKEKRLIKS